jgi:hypothetical protein
VLAACPAQINRAPGMRAASAIDGWRAIFVAVYIAKSGFAVGTGGCHSVLILNPIQ